MFIVILNKNIHLKKIKVIFIPIVLWFEIYWESLWQSTYKLKYYINHNKLY